MTLEEPVFGDGENLPRGDGEEGRRRKKNVWYVKFKLKFA